MQLLKSAVAAAIVDKNQLIVDARLCEILPDGIIEERDILLFVVARDNER